MSRALFCLMSGCSKTDPLLLELSRERNRVLWENGSRSWERSLRCGRNGPVGTEVNAAGRQEALRSHGSSTMQPRRGPRRSGPSRRSPRASRGAELLVRSQRACGAEPRWGGAGRAAARGKDQFGKEGIQWEGPHVEQRQKVELPFHVPLHCSDGKVKSRVDGGRRF